MMCRIDIDGSDQEVEEEVKHCSSSGSSRYCYCDKKSCEPKITSLSVKEGELNCSDIFIKNCNATIFDEHVRSVCTDEDYKPVSIVVEEDVRACNASDYKETRMDEIGCSGMKWW